MRSRLRCASGSMQRRTRLRLAAAVLYSLEEKRRATSQTYKHSNQSREWVSQETVGPGPSKADANEELPL